MTQNTAVLSNKDEFSSFAFGPTTIRFKTPSNLKKWLNVKKWDHGYIVAEALYEGKPKPVEEYIDLIPILEHLYIEPDKFLAPIKEVKVG